MLALLLATQALAADLMNDIDAVCAKPETLAVVIISGNPATPASFTKIESCTRDGNRLTLVQGEKDTIYINLDHYGAIQIGHGRTTWLRLFL